MLEPIKLPDDISCPVCHHILNGAMPMGKVAPPRPGDLTICLQCLSILKFEDKEFHLGVCSQEEFEELNEDIKEVMLEAIQHFRRAYKEKDNS